MSSAAQRSELQSQIWKIANEVRGSVDGWDFKQYVLGTLFYRFISENFSSGGIPEYGASKGEGVSSRSFNFLAEESCFILSNSFIFSIFVASKIVKNNEIKEYFLYFLLDNYLIVRFLITGDSNKRMTSCQLIE